MYAHMGRILVSKNQAVGVGDILGVIGLTGRTTGPHTHLEIKKDGNYLNPLSILQPGFVPQRRSVVNRPAPTAVPTLSPVSVDVPNINTANETIYQPVINAPQAIHFKQALRIPDMETQIEWSMILFAPMFLMLVFKFLSIVYQLAQIQLRELDPNYVYDLWYDRNTSRAI
jgi:hypothetical protein